MHSLLTLFSKKAYRSARPVQTDTGSTATEHGMIAAELHNVDLLLNNTGPYSLSKGVGRAQICCGGSGGVVQGSDVE
jgi:hypothetical protein